MEICSNSRMIVATGMCEAMSERSALLMYGAPTCLRPEGTVPTREILGVFLWWTFSRQEMMVNRMIVNACRKAVAKKAGRESFGYFFPTYCSPHLIPYSMTSELTPNAVSRLFRSTSARYINLSKTAHLAWGRFFRVFMMTLYVASLVLNLFANPKIAGT
jgi:hypothetical protein